MVNQSLRSLRTKILLPLLAISIFVAIGVAFASNLAGQAWARSKVEQRIAGIRATLERSDFPLIPVVLRSLADLSQTDMVALDSSHKVLHSTLPKNIEQHFTLPATESTDATTPIRVANQTFLSVLIERRSAGATIDGARYIVVLFDESSLRQERRRAVILPLVTGLTTTLLLSSFALWMINRLIRRLGQLERRVEGVAAGDFDSRVADKTVDEIGRLGLAVDSMSLQLKKLWKAVKRQEGEKLLHHIAGGMAHQLRNALTGARMAVELHQRDCRSQHDEGLEIAVAQIEHAEEYVQRLSQVGLGEGVAPRPGDVHVLLRDLLSSLQSVASHRNIRLDSDIDTKLSGYTISDGPTFSAAVSNLIINGIDAAQKNVHIEARLVNDSDLRLEVIDDGVGILPELGEDIFEPFVSTKHRGLGLGLALVKRAADLFSGSASYERRHQQTVFCFHAKVDQPSHPSQEM